MTNIQHEHTIVGYRGFFILPFRGVYRLTGLVYVSAPWEKSSGIALCRPNSPFEGENSSVVLLHLKKNICTCGFYMCKTLKDFVRAGFNSHVIAKVAAHGIVVEGEEAFRSSHMTILELYSNLRTFWGRLVVNSDEHRVNLLSEVTNHYKVPLSIYPESELWSPEGDRI